MSPSEVPHRRRADRESGTVESDISYPICFSFVVIVAAIGWADHLTGPELGFSLFYLIPIAIAAWYCSEKVSLIVATAAAVSWFSSYYADGHRHVTLSIWNGVTRLIIYGSAAWLIARLRLERQREAVLARTDTLTGLSNSRAFLEALAAAAVDPDVQRIAVMYLDCDNFKSINDRYGHAAGDSALQDLATAIGDAIRSDDLAARLGGDEFGILFRDADEATAMSIANRILGASSKVNAVFPGTAFGISAGIAVAKAHPFDPEALLRAADDAMYDVKRQHKGGVSLAQG